MQEEQLDKVALRKLGLKDKTDVELKLWKEFLGRLKNPKHEVNIGKYVELRDAYKSITEAFIHAGASNECKVKLHWIHSEKVNESNTSELLGNLDGILVAPGFGDRGIEGKLSAVTFARENNIPFLGICLGMQCAVIEYGRNVLGIDNAHSTEINPETPHPVIDIMEEQKAITDKGGTMRLGAYPCQIEEGSLAEEVYGENNISERHRHRFEFNNQYLEQYRNGGMKTSGINPDSKLVEIVEILEHPFFIGVQFHPEYKSTVANPQPLFVGFVKAALTHAQGK